MGALRGCGSGSRLVLLGGLTVGIVVPVAMVIRLGFVHFAADGGEKGDDSEEKGDFFHSMISRPTLTPRFWAEAVKRVRKA